MRWTIKPKPSEEKVKLLAEALNVEEFVATLLVQRGIETFEQARQFFRPTLEDLHNPYLMKDMDKAVERIGVSGRATRPAVRLAMAACSSRRSCWMTWWLSSNPSHWWASRC